MLTPLGTKAALYVLDLWLPESMDQIYARLERHHALVPAHGAAAASLLYGDDQGDEPKAEAVRPDKLATPSGPVSDDRSLSGESPSPPDFSEPEPEPEPPGSGSAFTPPADVWIEAAAAAVFPSGRYAGASLAEVAEKQEGRAYLKWAAANWKQPEEFAEQLKMYAEGLPA